MKTSDWYRLLRLYENAARLREKDRFAFIRPECRHDPRLLAQAQDMISDSIDTAIFRETIISELLPARGELGDLVGMRINGYRLERIISSGGMSTVYEARRTRFPCKVALKIANAEPASGPIFKLFESEKRVLSQLRHPGIVAFYDAGVCNIGSTSGARSFNKVPFIVMEYIPDARRITDYAWRESLGINDCLDLFLSVCDAVGYIHKKGWVHLDLKPGNIVVNGEGKVKLIDFGAAGFIETVGFSGSEECIGTASVETNSQSERRLVGTIQYMPPERCRRTTATLDKRSDIYALGLVLYEMLFKRMPYDLRRVSARQAIEIICNQPPERPDTGDSRILDSLYDIVIKAIEKDVNRRYRAVEELAKAIGRVPR